LANPSTDQDVAYVESRACRCRRKHPAATAPWPQQSSDPADSDRRCDRHRPVHGVWANHLPRRSGGVGGVRGHRFLRVLRAARDGRTVAVEPQLQVVRRLRVRPVGSCGGLLRGLVLLVRVDRHRHCGNRCHHRLFEVLVARLAGVATGGGHGRSGADVQPVQSATSGRSSSGLR
jgi:hypothetical protein